MAQPPSTISKLLKQLVNVKSEQSSAVEDVKHPAMHEEKGLVEPSILVNTRDVAYLKRTSHEDIPRKSESDSDQDVEVDLEVDEPVSEEEQPLEGEFESFISKNDDVAGVEFGDEAESADMNIGEVMEELYEMHGNVAVPVGVKCRLFVDIKDLDDESKAKKKPAVDVPIADDANQQIGSEPSCLEKKPRTDFKTVLADWKPDKRQFDAAFDAWVSCLSSDNEMAESSIGRLLSVSPLNFTTGKERQQARAFLLSKRTAARAKLGFEEREEKRQKKKLKNL